VSAMDVRFVEFDLPALESIDGAITLDALPATLTDAGSAAFGTYGPGEEMDPVSAIIPVAGDCDVVAAPANDEAQVDAAPVSAQVEQAGVPAWAWIVGILVILAIAIAVTVVVMRRRRANA
jgi:Htaa